MGFYREYHPIIYEYAETKFGKDFINDKYFLDNEDFKTVPFGELLRLLREDIRLTTISLAEKSEVSQSYISQLENEVRLPSKKVINRLSIAMAECCIEEFNEYYWKYNSQPLGMSIYDFNLERLTNFYYELLIKNKEFNTNKPKLKLGDDVGLENDEKELVNLYRSFNQDKKKQAISYMKFLKQN